MTENVGTVYEVTHAVDADAIAAFDAWLGEHVSAMLALPGIVRTDIFVADEDERGRPRRVSHYLFESDEALARYLDGPAETMRQSAQDAFGEKFDVSRRVLRGRRRAEGQLRRIAQCLNCTATLGGQYCGQCGQRATSRLISIWQLVREAFGDLLELDSRLWATLIPLVTRPGKLTREYLEGRRMRFMPPFRTYLVLSIVFFLIAFFDPREQFGILFNSDAVNATADSTITVQPDAEEDGNFCDEIEVDEFPVWLEVRLTPERLALLCERITADNGQEFFGKVQDNIPASLIFLLPLMALVLKFLYPLSRRYYVEHLLFVIHFHAFFFLVLTLQVVFGRVSRAIGIPIFVIRIFVAASFLYSFVYLYKSIRRVYAQGHLLSSLKFILLLFAYGVGIAVIIMFTALFAALSF